MPHNTTLHEIKAKQLRTCFTSYSTAYFSFTEFHWKYTFQGRNVLVFFLFKKPDFHWFSIHSSLQKSVLKASIMIKLLLVARWEEAHNCIIIRHNQICKLTFQLSTATRPSPPRQPGHGCFHKKAVHAQTSDTNVGVCLWDTSSSYSSGFGSTDTYSNLSFKQMAVLAASKIPWTSIPCNDVFAMLLTEEVILRTVHLCRAKSEQRCLLTLEGRTLQTGGRDEKEERRGRSLPLLRWLDIISYSFTPPNQSPKLKATPWTSDGLRHLVSRDPWKAEGDTTPTPKQIHK